MHGESGNSSDTFHLTSTQRAQLRATGEAFSSARTLPSWAFTDDSLFTLELRDLLSQGWFCVGHQSDFAPGEVRRVDLGDHSVLLSRARDGALRAFRNVCRHRGTRLLSESSSCGHLLVCPYHGWSYELDGTLRAAPGMEAMSGFDRSDHPLTAVELDCWNGLVFIKLGGTSLSLDETFADFPALGPDLASLSIAGREQYQVSANWKLLGENFNECYHCAGVHRRLHQLTGPASDTSRQARGAAFTGGPMMLRPGHNTMSSSGSTARPPLTGWPPTETGLVHYYHLFPNAFLSLVPDYVMLHLLSPLSVDRVAVETLWLFQADEMQFAGFDASEVISFWDETNRQDWALCETAQLGHRDGSFDGGCYHPAEKCVHDFDRWYAGWLVSR
ncbi:MAG: aromatic ring-hydroxylating dioxygenase subunit alpha [Pseudomonadota bacterium]